MTATPKPVRTVNVVCACGATFTREVKRGRPQVWCPACVAVPFYERNCHPVVVNGETFLVGNEAAAPVEAPAAERIVNENDMLDAVRVEIEAGMAEINMAHKVRFAALVATGMLPMDAAAKAQAETLAATQNHYARLAPSKYKPGREAEDVAA